MSSLTTSALSLERSKKISVLPLPYELRGAIYDELEPHITIHPQYPVNIRKAFEPDWDPGHVAHPMLGLNKSIDEEIKSRYFNRDDAAQPAFFPEKTTFRISAKCSRLQLMHMQWFLCHGPENRTGVKHVEFILDNYDGDNDNILDVLSSFPNLRTVKFMVRYKAKNGLGVARLIFMDWLKGHLAYFFDGAEGVPLWKTRAQAKGVRWAIEEWCILEGED